MSTLTEPFWVVVALGLIAFGWIVVTINGRRPVQMKFKGLGLDISITPCASGCKERVYETSENQPNN